MAKRAPAKSKGQTKARKSSDAVDLRAKTPLEDYVASVFPIVAVGASADVLGRCRQVLVEYQQGPLANYMPYTTLTEPTLHRLAGLQPKTLATMHGSAFVGDGARALRDLAAIFKDVLGPK